MSEEPHVMDKDPEGNTVAVQEHHLMVDELDDLARSARTLVISELHSVLVWRGKPDEQPDEGFGTAIRIRSRQFVQIRAGAIDLLKMLLQSEDCVLAFKSLMKIDNSIQIVQVLLEYAMPACKWEQKRQGGLVYMVSHPIQRRVFVLDTDGAIDIFETGHRLDLARVWDSICSSGEGNFDARSTVVLDCREEATSCPENVIRVPKWRRHKDELLHLGRGFLSDILLNKPDDVRLSLRDANVFGVTFAAASSNCTQSPGVSVPSFEDFEHVRPNMQTTHPSTAPTIITGSEFAASIESPKKPIEWLALHNDWHQDVAKRQMPNTPSTQQDYASTLNRVMQMLQKGSISWGSVFVLVLPRSERIPKTHTDGKAMIMKMKSQTVHTLEDDSFTSVGACTFLVSLHGTLMDASVLISSALDACEFDSGPDCKLQEATSAVWQLSGVGAAVVRVEPGDIYILLADTLKYGQGLRYALPKNYVKEELYAHMQKLDRDVASREQRILEEGDRANVRRIGILLRRWIHMPSWDAEVDLTVDEQPAVMCRLYVYKGAAIEVRVHLFEDASETYIHNHRTHFFSYCLGGDYFQAVWNPVPSGDTHHFEFNRTKDPELKEAPRKRAGKLEVLLEHQHKRDLCYFISASTFHQVRPALDTQRVLTMFVKGNEPITDTWVLAENPTPMWTKPNDLERILDGPERLQMLRHVRTMVCHK